MTPENELLIHLAARLERAEAALVAIHRRHECEEMITEIDDEHGFSGAWGRTYSPLNHRHAALKQQSLEQHGGTDEDEDEDDQSRNPAD